MQNTEIEAVQYSEAEYRDRGSIRGRQWSFWRRARRPGHRRLGRRPWSRPRSAQCISPSKLQCVQAGLIKLCMSDVWPFSTRGPYRRVFFFLFFLFLQIWVIKSIFYSMEFVTDARTFSKKSFTSLRWNADDKNNVMKEKQTYFYQPFISTKIQILEKKRTTIQL